MTNPRLVDRLQQLFVSGEQMSIAVYNLSQDKRLDDNVRKGLSELVREWDRLKRCNDTEEK